MKNNNLWISNPILFRSIIRDSYDNFVEKLYKYRNLIDISNSKGETLLHYACFLGMIDKYDALMNFGSKIQKTNQGDTLLHYASFSGYDDYLVIELIKNGFNPMDKNKYSQTSIHLSGNERIAQYFIAWSIVNNVKIPKIIDIYGNNVAHLSAIHKRIPVLNFWLSNFPEMEHVTNNDIKKPLEINKISKIKLCSLEEL